MFLLVLSCFFRWRKQIASRRTHIISYSEKKFSKNSSLVTHNAVNYCDIEDYSFDSPHTTRHLTRHPNNGILLIINILGARFTLSPLVTLKKGDE